jgi:multidrug efflux pump subunit AcrA (membrane-fusion protein)
MDLQIDKRTRLLKMIKRFWPLIALVCLAALGAGLNLGLGKSQAAADTAQPVTSVLRIGDIRNSAFGSGTLISAQGVDLGFEVNGTVKDVLVEVGDAVKEGDLLVQLDDTDLLRNLENAEADLRELTSDAGVAAAALQLAEAQKDVLSAESELKFLISPYVFKSEIRLKEAHQALQDALSAATKSPSEEAAVAQAQEEVDRAQLSLQLNWDTYYEKYVPDFFNFPWRDRFGYWHDYFDPPTETEVAVVWAELAEAQAQVEEGKDYLTALTGGSVPEGAYGSQLTVLEDAQAAVVDAQDALQAASLTAPFDGVIISLDVQALDRVGTDPILTIAQLYPPTIEASFDESDWSLVKRGSRVEVVFDSLPEKTYSGTISFVDPSLTSNRGSSLVSALVELDTSHTAWANLPLGSTASLEAISGEVQDVVLLPLEALQEDDGDRGMVLIQKDGEFIQQEVTLGLRDVLYAEVTSGLSVGDTVLIGNLN